MKSIARLLLVVSLAAGTLGGCVVAARPAPRHVWVRSHWEGYGPRRVWIGGHWA